MKVSLVTPLLLLDESPSRPNKVELNALMNINYGVSDNLLVRRRRRRCRRQRRTKANVGGKERRRKRETEERKRPQAHNDSERIVTLPLVARETGAIMRDSRSFASLGDRLFTYDSRKMNNLDRIGSFRSFRRLTVIRMKVKNISVKSVGVVQITLIIMIISTIPRYTTGLSVAIRLKHRCVECGKEIFFSFSCLLYNFLQKRSKRL